MALAFVNKDSGTGTANPSTTNSVAFLNQRLYILSVLTAGAGSDTSAVSGGGLTWVQVKDTQAGSESAAIWCGYVNSGASTGTLSITGTGTVSRIAWSIEEVTGSAATAANNGSDAFVQSAVEARTTSQTSSSVTLAPFADAVNNAAFGFTYVHLTGVTISVDTAPATYTLLANWTTSISLLTQYLIGEDTTVTSTWTGANTVLAVAAEIKAAIVSGGVVPNTVVAIRRAGRGPTMGPPTLLAQIWHDFAPPSPVSSAVFPARSRRPGSKLGPPILARQRFDAVTTITTTVNVDVQGALTLAGQTLAQTATINVDGGAVTFTGQALGLTTTINVDAGAITFAGQPLPLIIDVPRQSAVHPQTARIHPFGVRGPPILARQTFAAPAASSTDIVVTNEDTGHNDTPGATQATASIAFQNNVLYVLSTSCRGTTPSCSAPSGGGLTWTQTATTSTSGPFMNQWYGITTSGATTGTVTFTVNGTVSSLKWIVDSFTNVDVVTPVPHFTSFAIGTNGNGLATLSTAFQDPTNDVSYGAFSSNQTEASPPTLEDSNWHQVGYDASVVAATQTIFSEYRKGQDLSVACDWASASNTWAGNALEIRRAAAATTTTVTIEGTSAYAIALGVYPDYNLTRFSNAVTAQGGTITWVRIYPQPVTLTAAQLSTAIHVYSDQGYKVFVSFKSSFTWDQVASGSDDARWTDIGNALAAISPAGAWCFNHEPENDASPPAPTSGPGAFGSDANGDSFVAAFDHIASIIKPLAPAWLAAPCLYDEVFPSYPFGRGSNWQATPDPNRWIPTSADVLGVDYYWYRGAHDGGVQGQDYHWATSDTVIDSNAAITDFLSYADARAIPIAFPEFAATIRNPALTPGDEVNRTAWLQTIADDWAGDTRILCFLYFEVNDQDNSIKGNYAITDNDWPPMDTATVEAFVDFGDEVGGAGGILFTGQTLNLFVTGPITSPAYKQVLPKLKPGRLSGPPILVRQRFDTYVWTTTVDVTGGAVTFTGQSLATTTTLALGSGAVTFTGSSLGLTTTVNVDAGAVTFAGQDLPLIIDVPRQSAVHAQTARIHPFGVRGPPILARQRFDSFVSAGLVNVDGAGQMVFTGALVSTTTTLVITAGAVTFTGQALPLPTVITVTTQGQITLTGQTLPFQQAQAITAGAVTFTGQTLGIGHGLGVTAGQVTFTGASLAFKSTQVIAAGSVTFTGSVLTTLVAAPTTMAPIVKEGVWDPVITLGGQWQKTITLRGQWVTTITLGGAWVPVITKRGAWRPTLRLP